MLGLKLNHVILITAPTLAFFCGVVNNNKLDKIQERSMRILFNDYESDVHDLLDSIWVQPYGD